MADSPDIAVLKSEVAAVTKAVEKSTEATGNKIDGLGAQLSNFRLEIQTMVGNVQKENREELAQERRERMEADAAIKMEIQRVELQPGSSKWDKATSGLIAAIISGAVGALFYFTK